MSLVRTWIDREENWKMSRAPLIVALVNKDEKSVEELLDSGANVNDMIDKEDPIIVAILNYSTGERGLNIRADDPRVNYNRYYGMNALHVAAACSWTTDLFLEKKMIEKIEDVNAVSENTLIPYNSYDTIGRNTKNKIGSGNTALMLAMCNSYRMPNLRIIKLLMKHPNIDPNVQNTYNQTALHLAVAMMSECTPDVVKELLANNKIDISLKDNDGRTPLELAKYVCDWKTSDGEDYDIMYKVLKLLRSHGGVRDRLSKFFKRKLGRYQGEGQIDLKF